MKCNVTVHMQYTHLREERGSRALVLVAAGKDVRGIESNGEQDSHEMYVTVHTINGPASEQRVVAVDVLDRVN